MSERIKVCKNCGTPKPLSEFNKRAVSPDGHNARCKSCLHESSRKYYTENRELILERGKKYYKHAL